MKKTDWGLLAAFGGMAAIAVYQVSKVTQSQQAQQAQPQVPSTPAPAITTTQTERNLVISLLQAAPSHPQIAAAIDTPGTLEYYLVRKYAQFEPYRGYGRTYRPYVLTP